MLFGNIIFSEGIIEYADFTVPTSINSYINFYYPLWNLHGSYSTFETMPRLMLFGPFLLIWSIAGMSINSLVKFLALSPIFLSFVAMYIASNFLIRRLFAEYNKKYFYVASFLASFVYALNPWVISETQHFSLIWGHAFAPLVLITFIKYLEIKTNYIYLFVLALFLSLASLTPHWIVFNAIIISSWFLFANLQLSLRKDWKIILENILKCLKLFVVYTLLNFYWIIPVVVSSLYKFIGPSNILTHEVIEMLSRNANLLNVIRLVSSWSPQVNWSSTSYSSTWEIVSFILPTLAIIAFLSYRKNKYVVYFSFMALFFIFLGMGAKNLYPELYYWLSFDSPLSFAVGWIFRNPERWISLLALTYSFLILFMLLGMQKLIKSNRLFSLILILIFTFSFLFYVMPTIKGYSNNIINPIQTPNDYNSVNQWLSNQNEDFKVYWLPPYTGKITTWSNGHKIGAFDIISSPKPTIGPFTSNSISYQNYVYYEILLKNRTKNFDKYLDILNTRYVLVHNDIIDLNVEVEKVIGNLNNQEGTSFVKTEGFLSIFENKDFTELISVPKNNILATGGLYKFTELNTLNSFNPTNMSILFLDQNLIRDRYTDRIDYIILDSHPNLALNLIDEKYIIKPFEATFHHNLQNVWSKAMTSDPLHGDFHPYLERFGIQNWDFDYGYGLVLTYAKNTKLDMKIKTDKSDSYDLFVRYLQNNKGGPIRVYIDEQLIKEINTKDQVDDFVWEKVDTISLSKGKHTLTLENVEGFNAVNIFALLPQGKYEEYEQQAYELAQEPRNMFIFEAESDFNYINADKLKSNDPEYSNGQARVIKNGEIKTSFDVLKSSKYMIAVRALTCAKCGEVTLSLDKDYKISLKNSKDELKYIYLTTTLARGSYDLTLSSRDATVDNVFIYSTDKAHEDLDEVFTVTETPATITFEKINPTKYIVHVDAKKPFMTAFAESYDPLWVAYDKDKTFKVRPIPLYSVINGFYIEKTGKYDMVIEFEPQRYFYYGAVVSGLTILGSIGYLIYDWRKRKWKKRRK